jgi:hypothetical protein
MTSEVSIIIPFQAATSTERTNSEGYAGELALGRRRPEGEPRDEQADGHEREREQEKVPKVEKI